MNRLILYLIRKKLGVKKFQKFRFVNQKSKTDRYYFTGRQLLKEWHVFDNCVYKYVRPAHVSLNWLIDKDCKIEIV